MVNLGQNGEPGQNGRSWSNPVTGRILIIFFLKSGLHVCMIDKNKPQKENSTGRLGYFSFWDNMVRLGQSGAQGQNGSFWSNWYLDGS